MEEKKILRKLQLRILMEIIRICEANYIQWFMAGGTLLGAVRHKGFIPWDDDIDIGMLQTDYEKFVSVAPKYLGSEFYLDCYETDRDCPYVFSKVRLKGTVFLENKTSSQERHNEIFIDIFSYYYVSDDERIRKREAAISNIYKQLIQLKSGIQPWRGEKRINFFKFIPLRIISFFYKKEYLWRKVRKYQTKYSYSGYVSEQFLGSFARKSFPIDIFNKFILLEFEENKFYAPAGFDEYLIIGYGNYMSIPPESEQITHQIVKLDFGKYSGL